MGGGKFIKGLIVSGALVVGAVGNSQAYAGDTLTDPAATLRHDIISAFNKVSGKIVKFSDLRKAFAEAAPARLGFFERKVARDKIDEMEKSPVKAEGLIFGRDETGKMTLYVSTQYIQSRLVEVVDKGDADGKEDAMKRVSQTAVDAIENVPDQSSSIGVTSASTGPKR